MGAPLNLVGQQFGMLVVIERARHRGLIAWVCKCGCGSRTTITTGSLRSGNSKSCGCQTHRFSGSAPRHGMTNTRTFRVWSGAIQRCHNPNSKDRRNYADRGIAVCERWRHSFENFLADMGEAPKGKSLDRWPDNDGNYEPGNCRWATPQEQLHNTRVNRWITYNGETMILADWARRLGTSASALRQRWVREGVIKP